MNMKRIFSKKTNPNNSIIIPLLCLVAVSVLFIYSLFVEDTKAEVAPHVVISEIYGGGGNSGAKSLPTP
jgi:hypothetical protein